MRLPSASQSIYAAAGSPVGKWESVPTVKSRCATCAIEISSGVPTADLSGDAFSRQVDFIPFGNTVCPACAWLYSYPAQTHRNFLCYADRLLWPMISSDTATPERPQWLEALRNLAAMPPNTLAVGVLTTDPKPRLWPMTRLVTRQDFGLYVHCPDWDISEFRMLNLDRVIYIATDLSSLLTLEFNKRDCWLGLLRSKKAKVSLKDKLTHEAKLRTLRPLPEFAVALLVAQKTTMHE